MVGAFAILIQQSWFQTAFFQTIMGLQSASPSQDPPAQAAAPFPGPRPGAGAVSSATDLFRSTNIWEAHLHFTAEQWRRLTPQRIQAVPNWIAPDGTPTLRNPHASRAGVAGMLGWDLPWSSGDLEFGGVTFTNAGLRFKGNGTFLEAMQGYKKSFKVDLDEGNPGRRFAGQKTLNLHNLVADRSYVADTLGYEFYREAGVPAPSTTFARVFLSIDGRWQDRLLGLYVLIENPDKAWSRRALGKDGAALFKPVSTRLFDYLGEDWEPYDEIYAPRNDPKEAQRRRLIDLCKLVSQAPDSEFAERIGDYLDLDATTRFLACESLLSNYDGILMNGQNFILWLDPRTDRFGFSPWDLDHCWGEFAQVGSVEDRTHVSLFHPWVGSVRILERLFQVPDFQSRYRATLARLLDTQFIPSRLDRRIDELAQVIRPAVAEEDGHVHRLAAFEMAVAAPPPAVHDTNSAAQSFPPPNTYLLKRFISQRAEEARAQLEGRSKGVQLQRGRGW